MTCGHCLCESVAFEVAGPVTRVEVCHCGRCQRAYGSGLAATMYARLDHFRWLRGEDVLRWHDAPLLQTPPLYRHVFCGKCGSSLPICREEYGFVEIPVGLLPPADSGDLAYEMLAPRRHRWFEQTGSVRTFEGSGPASSKVLTELR